ncbi:alanine racemase, partial [Streptococcus danieliae]|nr:alanine racemase [Streptococcus danieliae]
PKAYPLGTKVVLIGTSGQEAIDVTQVADYRGTINYEVVCLLSDRIPRVYRK